MVDPVIDDRIDNDDHSTGPAPLAESVPQDGHFTASVLLDATQIFHFSSVIEMISECALEIYEAFLRVGFTIADASYEACSTQIFRQIQAKICIRAYAINCIKTCLSTSFQRSLRC